MNCPTAKPWSTAPWNGSAWSGGRSQLAGELSGGWKQRMALAACMLHDPKLLLLDEPTAGVDPKARRDFWEEIHALSDEGLTVLVSTHYMDEAERCDRIVYILNGKLVARGSVAEVIAQSGLFTFVLEGARGAPSAARAAGPARRRLCRLLRRGAACQRPRRAGAAARSSRPIATGPDITVTQAPPSLEDVFIQLQEEAQ